MNCKICNKEIKTGDEIEKTESEIFHSVCSNNISIVRKELRKMDKDLKKEIKDIKKMQRKISLIVSDIRAEHYSNILKNSFKKEGLLSKIKNLIKKFFKKHRGKSEEKKLNIQDVLRIHNQNDTSIKNHQFGELVAIGKR